MLVQQIVPMGAIEAFEICDLIGLAGLDALDGHAGGFGAVPEHLAEYLRAIAHPLHRGDPWVVWSCSKICTSRINVSISICSACRLKPSTTPYPGTSALTAVHAAALGSRRLARRRRSGFIRQYTR
jgi:hypothetical protein